MPPGLYVQPEQAPSPMRESKFQPNVYQNGFPKTPIILEDHGKAQSAVCQNGSHSYCLRWIVRISKWYPSMEEWDFLLQLLPANEARKVQSLDHVDSIVDRNSDTMPEASLDINKISI